MRITVFGAGGSVGSRVVAEAVQRGHEVTAVARDRTRVRGLDRAGLHGTSITGAKKLLKMV